MKRLIAVAALVALAACGGSDNKTTTEEVKQDQPLSQTKNSTAFNDNFSHLLYDYYHLKDALVLSSDTMAIASARTLASTADSLNVKELKADSSIVMMAEQYVQSLSAEAKALAGEQNLEARRKSFQVISDNLYELVRTVRYDQGVVYHQFCPMAFNNAGAAWLSATPDVKNPYFGKKMLTCGEVQDSVDFRGK